MSNELINSIKKDLEIEFPVTISMEELQDQLAVYINHLIQSDFNKLIFLLYRIDVDESKLKLLLKENENENSGKIIAGLIIQRQLQKLKSRNESKENTGEVPGTERW